MYRLKICLLAVVLLTIMAGCSGAKTPQMIASYPLTGQPNPPVSPPPDPSERVYSTSIFLQVGGVEQAAQKARELAERYSGYLSGWNSWRQDEQTCIQLVLEVPAPYFDMLRSDLLEMGTLNSENASSKWNPAGYGWNVYTEIVLTLTPKPSILPVVSLPGGWNPWNTFRQAFGFFWQIFSFLVDLLIWVLVVIGPFLLLALGIRRLVKH